MAARTLATLPDSTALRHEPAAGPQDAAARLRNRASWSGTQWKVAVDSTASTDPGAIGSGAPRSATTYSTRSPKGARRSRATSTIEGDPSTAMTRPRGRRCRSRSVTRPDPQPASITVSPPASGRRSRTLAPQRVMGSATRS